MTPEGEPSPRRGSSARGQSTAFVASMLFVMVLFVSVVANVGQAVNRRVALQLVADTGAYTGASVMAVGYNQLAYWNTWMQRAWAIFSTAMITTFYPPYFTECDYADFWEGAYGAAMAGLNVIYTVENYGYSFLAESEAARVSEYNASHLFPTDYRDIEYAKSDLASGIVAGHAFDIAPSEQVPDGTRAKAVGWALVPSERDRGYVCVAEAPPPIFVRFEFRFDNDYYRVWYRKKPNNEGCQLDLPGSNPNPCSFVWVARSPRTKALMFDRWFGGDIIPEMKAVAVAKPVGGTIEEGQSKYRAKFMPVSTMMALNRLAGGILPEFLQTWSTDQAGMVLDPEHDRGFRVVTH